MERLVSGPCCHPLSRVLGLPEEIIFNIISRLQVDSVLHCRLVCKTWKNLLSPLHDNHFADMHLCHLDTKLSFIYLGSSHDVLYYVEYDENVVQSYRNHKGIKLPLPADIESLIGSCNGLICFCAKRTTLNHDPVYIRNPITREFVHLPRFVMDNKHKRSYIVHGFGYHPSTNEYKVVRVYYSLKKRPTIRQVQVYTLGSGNGWRNKEEITHTLQPTPGVLLDGALHWISMEGNIVAFNLADEEFHCLAVIPGSSSLDWFFNSKLWMLGGWLCVVQQKIGTDAEIWLLKKNEEMPGSSSNDQSWSWSREFTIEFGEQYEKYQPFSITKSGEILLLYKGKSIVCCDSKPAVAKPKNLGDLEQAIIGSPAISHVNSFVSLKALGEIAEVSSNGGEVPNVKKELITS